MDYVTLNSKYRPKKIEELLHEDIKRTIKNVFNNKSKLPRLIVISGKTGSGKTSIARVICGQYLPDIDMRELIDGIPVDGVANISIESANLEQLERVLVASRKLKDNIPYNVVILDDFNDGYVSDQILLSRTLELPDNNVFIVCTNDFNCLNKTITNMCDLHLQINNLPKDTIVNHIRYICEKEGISIEKETVEYMVNSKELNIRGYINLLQSVLDKVKSYSITKEMVESLEVFESLTV